MNLTLPLAVFAFTLVACHGSKDTGEPGEEATGLRIDLAPPVGGQGTSLTVAIDADRSTFSFEDATVDFGDGIVVEGIQVLDGWSMEADIAIDPDAALGLRDVKVGSDGRTWALPEAFTVIEQSFSVYPSSGMLGETVQVEISGNHTAWDPSVTWASFGDGMDLIEFTVLSRDYALATVSIRGATWPGPRDVMMEDGPDVVVLYDGFLVDRVGLGAEFSPETAEQGDTVPFSIQARGTHFDEDSQITFWRNGDDKPDILVERMTVHDATNISGEMTLSNAAELGMWDVMVTTDDEGILIPDALEVTGGPLDLSNVGVSMSFYVVRGTDNSSCAVAEGVAATVVFYLPLDPPCGSMVMGSGPQPYDVNGVFEYPDTPEDDCPSNQTVGAGDHVWLESDYNVVTLDRYMDSGTGTIYYTNPNLTLADYGFDQWYDLHTEGEEGGVPEYLVEDIQPTVPADWTFLTPEMCHDFTWNRAGDLTYTWTPAWTYPDAFFITGIQGTLVESGRGGFIGAVPWDDGEHTYTSAELSQLSPSPVYFYAYSYIEGVEWTLPDSTTVNKTESMVYLQSYMVLE